MSLNEKKYINGKNNGFTLAETLITIVIIGVISAFVITPVINKYQKISMAKRLKATYSLLQSAINNSEANLENPNWVKEINEARVGTINTSSYIKKYITGGLIITKDYGRIIPHQISRHPVFHDINGNQISPTTTTGSVYYTVALANGSFLYINIGSNSDNTHALPCIYVDVNGWKRPNVLGKDLFSFWVGENKKIYLPGYNRSRNTILNTCIHSDLEFQVTCQSLVQHDNWEFKNDYPW